jgi:hypothetical protein
VSATYPISTAARYVHYIVVAMPSYKYYITYIEKSLSYRTAGLTAKKLAVLGEKISCWHDWLQPIA